jgi:hypothetical protein
LPVLLTSTALSSLRHGSRFASKNSEPYHHLI